MQDSHKNYINARKRLKVLLRSDLDDTEVRNEIHSISKEFPELATAFTEVEEILKSTSVKPPDTTATIQNTITATTQVIGFLHGVCTSRRIPLFVYIIVFFMTSVLRVQESYETLHASEMLENSSTIRTFINEYASILKVIGQYWSIHALLSLPLCALLVLNIFHCKNNRTALSLMQTFASFCIGDVTRMLAVYYISLLSVKFLFLFV